MYTSIKHPSINMSTYIQFKNYLILKILLIYSEIHSMHSESLCLGNFNFDFNFTLK